MSQPYTNDATAKSLTLDRAQKALLEIATILDGEPGEPGKSWTSNEVEWVAEVITRLGFNIREPEEEYESDDDDDDDECDGHESLDGAHMGEAVYCEGTCKTH